MSALPSEFLAALAVDTAQAELQLAEDRAKAESDRVSWLAAQAAEQARPSTAPDVEMTASTSSTGEEADTSLTAAAVQPPKKQKRSEDA